MQHGSAAPTRGGDAFGEHCDDGIEIAAAQIAIGIRAANELIQIVFAPGLGRCFGHNLLRQNIERVVGNLNALQITLADGIYKSRAFDQLVPRGWEQ